MLRSRVKVFSKTFQTSFGPCRSKQGSQRKDSTRHCLVVISMFQTLPSDNFAGLTIKSKRDDSIAMIFLKRFNWKHQTWNLKKCAFKHIEAVKKHTTTSATTKLWLRWKTTMIITTTTLMITTATSTTSNERKQDMKTKLQEWAKREEEQTERHKRQHRQDENDANNIKERENEQGWHCSCELYMKPGRQHAHTIFLSLSNVALAPFEFSAQLLRFFSAKEIHTLTHKINML